MDRPALAWRGLLLLAAAQLVLHGLTNGRYGIFRDEYYYLACADRLAWGYVDHPPLSIWLLAGWKTLFGDSIHALRILPALASAALIPLTGLVAAELGGRRFAQVAAGAAAGIGAAGLVIGGFYSMNALDLLVWVGLYALLARLVRTGDGRLWPWFGLLLAVGLLNKIGLVVFGVSVAIGLLATGHRGHLRDVRLWLAAAIAALGLLPYLLWNAAHDWPTREFVSNAQQYKITDMPIGQFLGEVTLEANPTTLLLWTVGLGWLLFGGRRRLLGATFVLTLGILLLQKSKPYYLAGSMPVLLAAGACAWEIFSERRRWIRWLWAANLTLGLLIFAPMAVPLLSPAGFLAYQDRLGIAPAAAEVGHTSAMPQHFSDRFGWKEQVRAVAAVYAELPDEDRESCIVLCANYGEAGALEYWSRAYDLPPVYSGHNNYWLWGPPPAEPAVVLLMGYGRETAERVYESVETGAIVRTEYAMESEVAVYVCRRPRLGIADLWPRLKSFI